MGLRGLRRPHLGEASDLLERHRLPRRLGDRDLVRPVAALVIGHVAALVRGHDRAPALYGDPREATRSQILTLGIIVAGKLRDRRERPGDPPD